MGFLATQHLRYDIKTDIDKLVGSTLHEETAFQELLPEIQHAARRLEKNIQEKIQLLESDFKDLKLSGDYLFSVRESFTDIEQLMRHSQTFIDVVRHNKITLIEHIQHHYRSMLIPLLNMMSKLENDYISIANLTITKKQILLNELKITLKKLKLQVSALKKSLVIYNKEQKMNGLKEEIQVLDLKRKMLQLSLDHDRINLYYFNHDHPEELYELKQKADDLRLELGNFKEMNNHDSF